MDFRIAATFTDSLVRLTGDEQKAAKTTAFDLQVNPANPGMSFHKLAKGRDKNFWSVRVSRDVRLIVHRTPQSLLLCYVGHHDDAYHWAACRKIETHSTTGAAQIVEVRERVEEITVPKYAEADEIATAGLPLFAGVADGDLLAYGVPPEWLPDVRTVDDDDALLALTEHLPAEASEALLELATGGSPRQLVAADESAVFAFGLAEADVAADTATPADAMASATSEAPPSEADAFAHPDAQRRFRTIQSREELERALEFPWDKWTIFLHPAQRAWVEKDYRGPARVSGSAGTGKTIVALHRAVHLARTHDEARLLLATFSGALANALRAKLRRLIGNEPRLSERIDVYAMDEVGARLYQAAFGAAHVATGEEIDALLNEASVQNPGHGFSPAFLRAEWEHVVDGWQLETWEQYRDVQRLGRRTRLPEARRKVLWAIYEVVRTAMRERDWITRAGMFARLAAELPQRRHPPYDFAIIDEAQDIDVAQLKFLAALGGERPDALFFAGDLGQRIFQQPFSWKSLGVDIRGRSRTLHVNYRTSHQIRVQADRLLDPVVADVDGNEEARRGTVSVFNGPQPEIRAFPDAVSETEAAAAWLSERVDDGIVPHEIAVFVRSGDELPRAQEAVRRAGLHAQVLDDRAEVAPARVAVSTMHLAKGLEFRTVVVMACDDEVIPSQQRIASVTDEADLEDVYNTERHLLYVACTRARDRLWVSAVEPASEFLDDLAEVPNGGRM